MSDMSSPSSSSPFEPEVIDELRVLRHQSGLTSLISLDEERDLEVFGEKDGEQVLLRQNELVKSLTLDSEMTEEEKELAEKARFMQEMLIFKDKTFRLKPR